MLVSMAIDWGGVWDTGSKAAGALSPIVGGALAGGLVAEWRALAAAKRDEARDRGLASRGKEGGRADEKGHRGGRGEP